MRHEGTLLDASGKVSLLLEKALKPEKSCFLPPAETCQETLYYGSHPGTLRGQLRSNQHGEVAGGERGKEPGLGVLGRAANSSVPGMPGPGWLVV